MPRERKKQTVVPVTENLDLLTFLFQKQNTDGGWSYGSGQDSRIEPTAWITLALQSSGTSEALLVRDRGLDWLRRQQEANGSFLGLPCSAFTGWTTSPALLALVRANRPGDQDAILKGLKFLVQDQAKPAPKAPPEMLGSVPAWGWTNNAFSWIEPTSLALITLGSSIITDESLKAHARDRRDSAETVLWARRCKDGGWNYGNTGDTDYALGSFPIPTALALIALQRHNSDPRMETAWQRLTALVAAQPSALSLAFTMIAGQALDRNVSPFSPLLQPRLPLLISQHVWAHGLALLALGKGASPVQFSQQALS